MIDDDHNYQVLVIDDTPEVRFLLAKLLVRMGHCVKTTDSGQNALFILNEFRADVIFSDISMPDMDGYEVVRQIRRRPDTRLQFVIAMTGNGGGSSEQASIAAGFDAHLPKPFDVGAIQRILSDPN